jgi:hypothetical protein
MDLALSAAGPTMALLIVLTRTHARELGLVTCVCAALAFGIGLSSVVWWLLIQLPVESRTTLVYLDVSLWAAVILIVLIRMKRKPRSASSPHAQPVAGNPVRRMTPGLTVALIVLIPIGALAVTIFAATSYVQPHGSWDAWSIWNARARVLFLSLPGDGAPAVAHPVLVHSGYPQLLPASVARAWTLAGTESVGVPIGIAAMFAASVVIVIGASVRRRTTSALGVMAPAFLLASPTFGTWASSQGADVPLSLYFLLTWVFASAAMTIGRTDRRHGAPLWTFAGVSAGLAAWTKNEGLAFVCVCVLVLAVWAWRRSEDRAAWRSLAAFTIGAAPVLLVVTAFKLVVAPPNEIVSALTADRVMAMLAWDRIVTVLGTMARELWFGGATTIGVLPVLVAFIAASGMPGRGATVPHLTFLAIAGMLTVDGLVYVMTPYDLTWHLHTSADRVLLQILPLTVWAGLLLAGERDPRTGMQPTKS